MTSWCFDGVHLGTRHHVEPFGVKYISSDQKLLNILSAIFSLVFQLKVSTSELKEAHKRWIGSILKHVLPLVAVENIVVKV